jgi:hypothetical protein
MREFFRKRPWMWIVIFCVLFVLSDLVLILVALHDAPDKLIP